MAKRHLGLQLYSLRTLTGTDFVGTLQKVAEIGYEGVELAGFANLQTAEEVAKAVDEAGLKVCSAHVGIEQFETDLAGVMKKYETIGCENLIIPALPQARRENLAGWKSLAKSINKIGKALKKNGFNLGYHNHAFEFNVIEKGLTGWDILLDETDKDLVQLELDVFWTVFGGRCPLCTIKKNADRLMSLHMKDMRNANERKFASVGEGILDIPAIVKAGAKAKVPWYIVEQDDCYGQDPLQAVAASCKNLKPLL